MQEEGICQLLKIAWKTAWKQLGNSLEKENQPGKQSTDKPNIITDRQLRNSKENNEQENSQETNEQQKYLKFCSQASVEYSARETMNKKTTVGMDNSRTVSLRTSAEKQHGKNCEHQ